MLYIKQSSTSLSFIIGPEKRITEISSSFNTKTLVKYINTQGKCYSDTKKSLYKSVALFTLMHEALCISNTKLLFATDICRKTF